MGGGKTQQRVAGNAKPSNSGRIRELLINQKVVPGNVITFSALSGKAQQTNHASKSERPTNVSKSESKPVPSSDQLEQEQRQEKPETVSQKNSDYRLIVRRVGNRDLYTRVKVSDLSGEESIVASDAGVKKPPSKSLETSESAPDVPKPSSPTGVDDDLNNPGVGEDLDASDSTSAENEENLADDADEKLDFFGLLDRLEQARLLANRNANNLRELDEKAVSNETDLLKLIRILMRKFVTDLSIEDWDLISTALNRWVVWISKADLPLQDHHAYFCAHVFKLIHQLIVQAEQLAKSETSSFPLMQSLLDDWANFKSSQMFLDLITIFLKLVASENAAIVNQENGALNSTNATRHMIEALAHIIVAVDTRVFLSHHDLLNYLSTAVQFDQEFKLPKNSLFSCVSDKQSKSFAAVCGLLKSNSRAILITAHSIMSKTMKSICGSASTLLTQDQDVVDEMLIFPPEPLMAILTSRDSMMSALLSDYRVGDISVTIEPDTDSYACTLSYLFTWDLAIQFIVGVDKELGQCMIHSLKRLGLIQRLLDNIFMLLPPLDQRDSLFRKLSMLQSTWCPSCSSCDSSNLKEEHTGHHSEWTIDSFLKSPLRTAVKRPKYEIELIALHIYFSVALHMPVTVRKWYNNNANKKLCNLVNEYTVKHVSKIICSLEMDSVQEKCQERGSKNLAIKARPTAKEVYAIYTRDEFKMELTIKLPQNYPLGPVQIDGGKRVGVTDVKWRSWLLQLTTFLSHQNGPILDGIDLWRRNIDKRFEGVEKCTICFSILHSNYQLPKKRCQTCANMFHNLCLYKWFESSGNSTCPLCRNPW